MSIITRKNLSVLINTYSPGSRVQLVSMHDPYCKELSPGAMGTVAFVDAVGTIHVNWDCGSTLGIVYGVDSCKLIYKNYR